MDKLNVIQENNTWYKEGVSFQCTGCGECCTGSPGYTWVTEEEIENIAEHLEMPVNKFMMRYVRRIGNRFSLVELKKSNYDCVFLENKKCTIYPVRPKQCRTYPWWPENLSSQEAWASESSRCEGMRCKEPVVKYDDIKKSLDEHLNR